VWGFPEAVEGQQFGFFRIRAPRRARQVSQHVDRQPAVATDLLAHLQAKPEVAGIENVRAPVVLDGVAAGGKLGPGRGFDLRQGVRDRLYVDLVRQVLVSGSPEHVRKLVLKLLY
jgi:hypothetical protein